MNRWQHLVTAFHAKMRQPVGDRTKPQFRRVAFRMSLIDEEVKELKDAIAAGDFVAAIDALVDILYVVVGTAVEWGIDLDPFFDEVQRANMDKRLHPQQLKPTKPRGWVAPAIAKVLRQVIQREISNAKPAR